MNLWLLGEGVVREFGMDFYTLLYINWITNKDFLYGTWNSTQYYVAAWMGGEFEGEWIHIYVCLSPFCLPEITTTLLIGYIPKQNVFGVKIQINLKSYI